MKRTYRMLFASVGVVMAVNAASAQTTPARAARNPTRREIARALSAAPAAIADGAAVVQMDDKGLITPLRSGDNGWTCLPKDPGTPLGHPVCLDRNGLAWFRAAMAGQPPDPNIIGYSYMLQGGTTWSNLDPAATKLPESETAYVTIPPHVMILNAKLAADSGFPSGVAHPDAHKPFVMYGGTPYALIVIPVR